MVEEVQRRKDDPQLVLLSIKRTLRVLVGTTVLAFVLIGVISYLAFTDAARANHALCTLRADLEGRVTASKAFLAAHPGGFNDIPAATIRTSIVNQQHTIDSLSDLSC